TGNYSDTLVNVLGCDSIISLDLIVNPISNSSLTETICSGDSYTVGTSVYTLTGNYSDTLVNVLGCDSIISLDLIVNPISNSSLTETICSGDSYTVGTSVYTLTGNYSDTLVNVLGCDSIISLGLTVNPISNSSLSETICSGDNYTVGTSVYTLTGNYSDTLVNVLGCDSIISLGLTVNTISNSSLTETICSSENYTVGTSVYTSTGNYSDTLVNVLGCDSIISLDLIVNPISNSSLTETICSGDSYTVGTSVYTLTGNYSDT
ncbi:MAG: hypothetical protein ACPG49_14360, partial [Chitinophagales bacterium]